MMTAAVKRAMEDRNKEVVKRQRKENSSEPAQDKKEPLQQSSAGRLSSAIKTANAKDAAIKFLQAVSSE